MSDVDQHRSRFLREKALLDVARQARADKEQRDAAAFQERVQKAEAQGLPYILHLLGFKSYGAYLGSRMWRKIRSRVLRAARYRCHFCPGRAWQIHHTKYTYANLSGESVEHLFAVCEPCHKAQHVVQSTNR